MVPFQPGGQVPPIPEHWSGFTPTIWHWSTNVANNGLRTGTQRRTSFWTACHSNPLPQSLVKTWHGHCWCSWWWRSWHQAMLLFNNILYGKVSHQVSPSGFTQLWAQPWGLHESSWALVKSQGALNTTTHLGLLYPELFIWSLLILLVTLDMGSHQWGWYNCSEVYYPKLHQTCF